jgi:NADPH-dependent 2,4-dienoyl-CoA reductase/sulfur reductase-like enzyme
MGRKLLADPELPNKLAQDKGDDVRPCMLHYRCISQIFVSSNVSCVVNAFTGRESELRFEPATTAQRVLVVGGGPAGLEAARLAAMRGHTVTLVEANDRLGGRFALAAATSLPNAELLGWLTRQVSGLPIDVRLETRITPEEIAEANFDAVWVATGAHWRRPEIPGAELDHVLLVDQLRPWLAEDPVSPSEPLVILGGDKPGVALGGVARKRGAEVTILEEGEVFARSNGVVGRWRYVHEAREQGIVLEGGARVVSIEPGRVVWENEEGGRRETPAERVIVTSGAEPDPTLLDSLRTLGVPARAIGDCRELKKIEGAMLDATQVATGL